MSKDASLHVCGLPRSMSSSTVMDGHGRPWTAMDRRGCRATPPCDMQVSIYNYSISIMICHETARPYAVMYVST